MRSYVERAKDFIQQAFPFMSDCGTVEDFFCAMLHFNERYNRKVIVDNGAARVALITSDYVVKVDYNEYKVHEWGGCEAELAFYEFACSEGYGYLFAEITKYTYGGRDFYIMPRVHGIGKTFYEADEYMTADEAEWCWDVGLRDLHNENYGWKGDKIVIIDYGANEYREEY